MAKERKAEQAEKCARFRDQELGAAEATLRRIGELTDVERERGRFSIREGRYQTSQYNAYAVFEEGLRGAVEARRSCAKLTAAERLALNGAVTMTRYSDGWHFERLVRLFAKGMINLERAAREETA